MQRDVVKLGRRQDRDDTGFVPGTMAERLEIAWQLTREAYSLSGTYDVERRLQRHVVVLAKRGR